MGDDRDDYRWMLLIRNNRAADDYSRIIEMGKTFGLSGSTVGSQLDVARRQSIDVDQWMRVFALESLAGINGTYNHGLRHNFAGVRAPGGPARAGDAVGHGFACNSPTAWVSTARGSNLRKIIDIPQNRRCSRAICRTSSTDVQHDLSYAVDQPLRHRWRRSIAQRRSCSYITPAGSYVLSQLLAPVTFAITTNGGADLSVTTPTATIEGNGWINVREIRLAGSPSPLDVTWIDRIVGG